jgi:hypothetical protein
MLDKDLVEKIISLQNMNGLMIDIPFCHIDLDKVSHVIFLFFTSFIHCRTLIAITLDNVIF